MALILLLVIFIIIVITAGLFLLTGNVAILGLIGVTIGAVFGILQTIIGATWLEPLKRRQERVERKRDREEEREEKENHLRRAIYREIFSITVNLGGAISSADDSCKEGSPALKSADRGQHTSPPPFRVYNSLKDDSASFYQLEDAMAIDSIYDHLTLTSNRVEAFRRTPFDTPDKAQAHCEVTIAQFKLLLLNIDSTLNEFKANFQNLNNGQLLRDWADLRRIAEDALGSIEESPLLPDGFKPLRF